MSFVTLSAARSALWQYASKVPYAARTATDEASVSNVLNLVVERFLSRANFRGSFATARLRVFDEQVTLPNPLDTIRGARVVDSDGNLGKSLTIFNQQANFATGSCACLDTYGDYGSYPTGGNHSGLRDLGEGFPTFRDYDGEFYVRCKSTHTETGTTILLRGLDENGEQIYTSTNTEGVSLNVTTATTTTTQKFTTLDFWVKAAATNGVIQLYAVDTTTAEETLLVNITPGKLTSGYRRYSAKGIAFGTTIEAICQVKYIPAVADNDLITPGNLGALKLGMMSLQYEDKNDMDRADDFMARALDLLENDRDQFDGDDVSLVAFSGFGSRHAFIS